MKDTIMVAGNTTTSKRKYSFVSCILLNEVVKGLVILSKPYFRISKCMKPILIQAENERSGILTYQD